MKKRQIALNLYQAKQQGQALIIILVFLSAFALTLVLGYQATAIVGKKTSRQSIESVYTYALSEGGIEDAILRLRQDPQIGRSSPQTLELYDNQGHTVSTVVETIGDMDSRTITATGTVNKLQRKTQAVVRLSVAEEGAFRYAIQVGNNGLTMRSNSRIEGNVYSNSNIVGSSQSQITGDAYAHTAISSPDPTVSGTKQLGVPIIDLPYVNIDYWKNKANMNNDPYEGDLNYYGVGESLGPKRINGNLTVNSNSDLIVTGPIYVTGNIVIESNSIFRLDQAFGSQGTVVIADGTITINSNSQVLATSADPKGYLLIISTLSSISPAAILLSSNSTQGLIYAYNGAAELNSNCHLASVTGHQIILNSNAVLTYDTGLGSGEFVIGPGGGWAVLSWKEIE